MTLTLPFNEDAEKAVLGSILLDNENIYRIIELIEPEDFYLKSHAIIYKTILEVFAKGKNFDILTIKNELQTKGLLDTVGGTVFLSTLIDNIPMMKNIKEYASIVADKANVRRLMQMANDILEKGSNESIPGDELIKTAEDYIFKIATKQSKSSIIPVKQAMEKVLGLISERKERFKVNQEPPGVASGYRDLQTLIPGFQPGELIILAARPSVGKTSFALSLALKIAKNDKTMAIFSLEMPYEQIAMRMLCSEAEINVKQVREGSISDNDYFKLAETVDRLVEKQIYIDDSPTLTVADLRAKLLKLKTENGLDIVIIDYLQLMQGKEDNRVQEISAISRGLKILAKELEVPFIVLSQLNRSIEKRSEGKPQLSDLRESGAIEQDADIVAFLHRKKPKQDHEKVTEISLIVAKNRNGPTGEIMLAFLNEYTKFENYMPNVGGEY